MCSTRSSPPTATPSSRARERVASRPCPKPTEVELKNGIPVFLDQLVAALKTEASGDKLDHDSIGQSAGLHGQDLLRMGLTVAQVVHDYGDVCQAITGLAIEQQAPISTEEFRTLNLCLDDAIAEAVTAYSTQRERTIAEQDTERLGVLAHELRNFLNTATLSFDVIKQGQVAAAGSTSLVLTRSLNGLRNLIDRSLADVRLDAGIDRHQRISVAELVEEVEIGALLTAKARQITLSVTSLDPAVTIEGDREILAAALANLLQNAFKFSCLKGHVSLTASATADRVLFDVEDECGGLPEGKVEELFAPYSQRSGNRSGVGLGLAICRKAAHANGGEIRVRNIAGKGCVFTLDLPRKPPPPLTLVDGGKGGASKAGEPSSGAAGTGGTGTPRARAVAR